MAVPVTNLSFRRSWATGGRSPSHGQDRLSWMLGPSAELLADPDEQAAPLAPLRGADANAAAASDLVHLVEQVQHVGADRHALERSGAVEILRNPGVEYPVAGQRCSVRHNAVRIVGPEPRGIDEIHRRDERADPVLDRVAAAARCRPFLRMVGVNVMIVDVGKLVRREEILARDDVLALLGASGEIRIEIERAVRVIATQFDTPGIALGVVERRQDQP